MNLTNQQQQELNSKLDKVIKALNQGISHAESCMKYIEINKKAIELVKSIQETEMPTLEQIEGVVTELSKMETLFPELYSNGVMATGDVARENNVQNLISKLKEE